MQPDPPGNSQAPETVTEPPTMKANDTPPLTSTHLTLGTTASTDMDVSPPNTGTTTDDPFIPPPLPQDSTNFSEEEDEPPLKTLKTTTTKQTTENSKAPSTMVEQSGKTVMAKGLKPKKKAKGKHPAVNVAGGKTEVPL